MTAKLRPKCDLELIRERLNFQNGARGMGGAASVEVGLKLQAPITGLL